MACGEPQWWYDLVGQDEQEEQQPIFSNFIGTPLFEKPLLDEGSCIDVSVGCRGEVNSCGEVTLGAPFTCSLPFELEEDTPKEAYERAMKPFEDKKD